MRRVNPTTLAIAALGIVALLLLVLLLGRSKDSNEDRLEDNQINSSPAARPEGRCASQTTYDRIKRELFRQAAQIRQSDQAAFDQISASASVRMERPVMTDRDEDLGTIRCSGHLSLDLPPGVAVVGGRRSLVADIDYVLQPAADNSGDVVMVEGADPIIIPLATLAHSGKAAAPPPAGPVIDEAQSAAVPAAPVDGPVDTAPQPARPEGAAATTQPSFNCRHARTRGEIAVCRDPGLAALDRQMAGQYYRAIAVADRGQRATLTATRDSFLRYRDRCPNDACIAETYRGRMREIRDIMSGNWQPQR